MLRKSLDFALSPFFRLLGGRANAEAAGGADSGSLAEPCAIGGTHQQDHFFK
jgi:hypothetical protein